MWSLSECIPWMAVGLAESVAIATVNLCTIIVFMRNRNLRKRSTYLVINLAVIDMLAGGSAVYDQFYLAGVICNVWKLHSIEGWAILHLFLVLFPLSSLTNITIIALERMHATFRPLRHRVLKKSVYGIIIAVVWVTASLVAIAHILFAKLPYMYVHYYLRISFFAICLLIISVSYVSIVIKVRCGAQPQHHGAASREMKLTMTLLIVTVVSLLLYLPFVVFFFLVYSSKFEILQPLSDSEVLHLLRAISALYYANHLANPILYAIRMPEYRSAVLALFRKRPQQQRKVVVLPLRDM